MAAMPGRPLSNGASAQESSSQGDIMPIAIVGMGCRFPGGASSPDRLWDLCFNARTAWSEVPKDRFHQDSFFHPNPDRSNCTHSRGGHFLENDLSRFDAQFFSMTANEAKAVDPQQRLILECAYEALENAGIPLKSIAGQNIGVFIGGSFSEYAVHMMRDTETIPTYHMTGTDPAILSNRVSYFLGLHGPSLTVDTACSSSLTAIHLACQSLRAKESTQAIVGGTHLNVLPDRLIAKSNIRLLSSEGRSFAFDSRANGFGPGEGAGCLILKPLEDAIKAGDPIRAVIRNSGINQDGRTKGLTLPSGRAQEALSRHVYESAGLDPAETDYVETHGTGTAVGDLVEAQAVNAVFGYGRSLEKPIYVGSVKSNIGHAEGASGIVSMIKAVMMLEKGYILPNANFEIPNPEIASLGQNMKVSSAPFMWPNTAVRRASVSNFGFGGSNAHIIVEEAPTRQMSRVNGANGVDGFSSPGSVMMNSRIINGHAGPIGTWYNPVNNPIEEPQKLCILAANDKKSLYTQRENLLSYLKDNSRAADPMFLRNLVFTLGQRRSLLAWKIAYVTDSRENLIQQLEQTEPGPLRTTKEPEMAFIFTGQGAQWYRMGRELIFNYPVFASAIDTITMTLIDMGASYSLKDELMMDAKSSRLGQAFLSQPACTAIQIAMVLLLRSWGIRPTVVTGHSSGEITAAFAAGALTLQTCMSIAYHRGEAISVLKRDFPDKKGAMLALGASEVAAMSLLEELGISNQVAVACINSPSSVTISGDEDAIHQLQEAADKKFYFNRKLHVDVAYHSHHMKAIAETYRAAIGTVKPSASRDVQFVSSLTGVQINTLVLGSSYWVRNLVSPVRFLSAIQKVCAPIQSPAGKELFVDVFVEIGPHSALQGPIKEILDVYANPGRKLEYLPSLIRNMDAVDAALQLASKLFIMGTPVDFSDVNFPNDQSQKPQVLLDLPTYPWNHENKYWHESRLSRNHRFRQMPRSDILGILASDSNDIEPRWRNVIQLDHLPWLRDHKVQSDTICPMSFFLAMALEAAYQKATLREIAFTKYVLREIVVGQALVIPESSEVETLLNLRPLNESTRTSSDIWEEFIIFSWTADRGWMEHCRGQIGVRSDKTSNSVEGEQKKATQEALIYDKTCDVDKSCLDTLNCNKLYETYANMGLVFGPSFQSMVECRVGKESAVAQVKVPQTLDRMPYQCESRFIIHPALLDSFFQLSYPILTDGLKTLTGTPLALRVRSMSISHRIVDITRGHYRVYGNGLSKSLIEQTVDSIVVMEPDVTSKIPLISIGGFTSATLSNIISNPNKGSSNSCWETEWQPLMDLMTSQQIRDTFQNPPLSEEERGELQRLEQASLLFIKKALAQLSKEEHIFFQNHHKNFYSWMQDQCATSKLDSISSNFCSYQSQDSHDDFPSIIQSSTPGGEALCKIGECITQIMRQEIDSSSLFVESGLLSQFRDDLGSTKRNYKAVSFLVNNLAHQNPRMRILEIRAGRGGATRPILDILGSHPGEPPRFERYDFTDVTNRSFDDAKHNLKTWSDFLSFSELDVEKDPVRQGHAFETYDLVIVSDILQKSVTSTKPLENIRKLLKPRGKLLAMENSRRKLLHFPFRLFPSWIDNPLEPNDGGEIEQNGWDTVLKHSGFSGIDGSVPEYPGESEHSASVLISTAVAPEVHEFHSNVVIVRSNNPITAWSRNLQDNLKQIIPRCSESMSMKEIQGMSLDGSICIFLDDTDLSVLADPSPEDFDMVKKLCSSANGILWVTQGAQSESTYPFQKMATGLMRTIRNENAGVQLVTLDLEGQGQNPLESTIGLICNNICMVYEKVFISKPSVSKCDVEYLVRNGVLHIPRIVESPQANQCVIRKTEEMSLEIQPFAQKDRPLRLTIETPGFLDSLYFLDDEAAKTSLMEDDVEIRVEATGVNFRDIMYAVGQISSEHFGGECSGTISALGSAVSGLKVGDRVCALTRGGYSTLARCSAHLVAKIPHDVPFVAAAAIPVAFSTAYYSMIEVARLSRGETILIHAAAGGVGQAALRLAQWIGAEIFATVGSPEKKAFLMDTFGISEDHIYCSRDISFVDCIKLTTKGKGVDVVLNSLAGEALKASLDCLAHFGRFVEIGKQDLMVNTRIEMNKFTYNVTYATVDLLLLQAEKTQLVQRILSEVTNLIFSGIIDNVATLNVFPTSKLEAAFRFMQSGRSTGKIVVEAKKGDQVKAIIPNLGSSFLSKDSTYLITGGSGGLGRSVTKWFVNHGARYVVIASRSGTANEKVLDLVRELQILGATVTVKKCDVSVRGQVEKLFEECSQTMPPIKGVLHGSAVFQDVIFERSSYEEYTNVIKPKVDGAWNLHHVFRDLEFFVMLGSVASIIGNRGQAAYSAASTFLSAFAQTRINQGLPAATISLGAVQGVGYIAENSTTQASMNKHLGLHFIDEEEVHALIHAAIRTQIGASRSNHEWISGLRLKPGAKEPFWLADPKFAHVRRAQLAVESEHSAMGQNVSIGQQLKRAKSLDEAQASVCNGLSAKISGVLMVAIEDINIDAPMATYGLDSLVAVEVRNWVVREFDVSVSVFDLLSGNTLRMVSELVVKKSKLVDRALLQALNEG